MAKENTTPYPDKSIIAFITLRKNFDLRDELTKFLEQKGYNVTYDSSEIEDADDSRLQILIREQI